MLEIFKQSNEPVSNVYLVAHQYVLTVAQLFYWHKAILDGSLVAVGTNRTFVSVSELQ
jgi:hypothetical protein